jgi:hypothetical protein
MKEREKRKVLFAEIAMIMSHFRYYTFTHFGLYHITKRMSEGEREPKDSIHNTYETVLFLYTHL